MKKNEYYGTHQAHRHHRRPERSGEDDLCSGVFAYGCGVAEFCERRLIAAGLSPFAPELAAFKAGRIMLETIEDYAKRGESFSFETTLSGLTYAQMIPSWRASGYVVNLIFLSLPDVEMAIERVAIRVRQGGHNIPDDVIHRRYAHGIANFERYKLLVDSWQLYDNSDTPAVLVEEGQNK